MNIRTYTQTGTFCIAVFLSVLVLTVRNFLNSGTFSGPESFIHFALILTLLSGLLFFYKLTIRISDTHVSFKFGIGLYGKSYELSDISSVSPVKNSIFSGIGVRILMNGWLYNVSGLKAIELRFKSRSSVVRIGTNRPEEISAYINGMLDENIGDPVIHQFEKKRFTPGIIVTAITITIAGFFFFLASRDVRVEVKDSKISISGLYGETIPLRDLTEVDKIAALPKIDTRTNGYAAGNTKTGNFRLANGTAVKLFVHTGYPPYIRIQSKDRKPIYVNFEDRQRTEKLYNLIVNKN